MQFSPSLQNLIEALRCLPGVGPKSAQRMTLHLLERDREGAAALADALQQAVARIDHCSRCRNFTELEICEICADPRRDATTICVVGVSCGHSANKIVEDATGFRGLYFVLMGHLSPIDGIGPEEIGLDRFHRRVVDEGIREVILATNPTVEGEATAYYLIDMLQPEGVRVSRIAHGVPLGGELEYVDGSTLAHAFLGRRTVE